MELSTINPLFLDSTKPIGDKVVTNVELIDLVLKEGESIHLEVWDQFGFAQKYDLKVIETKKQTKYVAEVWLKYQHEIQYRFIKMMAGSEVSATPMRDARAGHLIEEKWDESALESPVVRKTPTGAARSPRKKDTSMAAPKIKELKTSSAQPLGRSHFLDQIKDLLDDLL